MQSAVSSDAKRRVGIVTYIKNVNYGSVLQAFALQEFIASLGYDAGIVDFLDMSNAANRRERRLRLLSGGLWAIRAPHATLELRLRTGHAHGQPNEKRVTFDDFERERIRFFNDAIEKRRDYCSFVCGSDQIWNLSVPGLHRTFFLRFASPAQRVAYAPSFGSDVVPSFNRRRLKKWISGFRAVSVREASGVDIVSNLTGNEPFCALDPVLLAGSQFWRAEIAEAKCQNEVSIHEDYLLCYFLSDNDPAISMAMKEANRVGRQILWVETGVRPPKGVKVLTPSPLEFVSLVDGAACFATDSFHGLAFALMLKTPFLLFNRAYEANAKQATRIESLLNIVHADLGDESAILRCDSSGLDWNAVSLRLEEERGHSAKYLVQSLDATCRKSV